VTSTPEKKAHEVYDALTNVCPTKKDLSQFREAGIGNVSIIARLVIIWFTGAHRFDKLTGRGSEAQSRCCAPNASRVRVYWYF